MNFSTKFILLPILFVSLLLLSTGCKKDNTLDRVKFIGSYNVSETCDSGNDGYTLTIAESPTEENRVIISNFYGVGDVVSGTVSSSALSIPSQTVGGNIYSGGGTYGSNDIMSINFIVTDGTYSENCTAICTKL